MSKAKDILKEEKKRVVDGTIKYLESRGESAFEDLDGNIGIGMEKKKEIEGIRAIKEVYPKIIKVLKKYCDLDEKYYNIIALWIIGTYMHNGFLSYPYLYFNAMKGSGKTRILNLISHLSNNGKLVVNMSEAVLFRTAKGRTLCIDEFEGVGRKDNNALRELLNAAYKKGMIVERAKKVKTLDEEGYKIEGFDVYCPVVMANIWGMEGVLGDRCISITLEKSIKPKITKLMEIFGQDEDILEIKRTFSVVCVVSFTLGNVYMAWNNYVNENRNDTNDTNNTNNTNDTNDTFFKKIIKTSLDSRHLELFFPLFLIANSCDDHVLLESIETAEWIVKEKKSEDVVESSDVALISFISQQEETEEYIAIRKLTAEFKEFMDETEKDSWIKPKWIGRALKRLGLIIEKRRLGNGREVIINFKKAKDKIKMFKEIEPESDLEVVQEKIQEPEKIEEPEPEANSNQTDKPYGY